MLIRGNTVNESLKNKLDDINIVRCSVSLEF